MDHQYVRNKSGNLINSNLIEKRIRDDNKALSKRINILETIVKELQVAILKQKETNK